MGIDPGLRTRHTIWASDGHLFEIGGAKDRSRLWNTLLGIDTTRSERFRKKPLPRTDPFQHNHQKRQRLRRKERKLWRRVHNLTREISLKTIKFLLDNADVIVLPPFEVQNMVQKGKRKLRATTCRGLLQWSHGWFKERLLEVAKRRYPHRQVLIASEAYTTQGCGRSGELHTGIGSKKTFVCPCAV